MNPMPVHYLFTESEFSEPPVEEMSPREYFDMISLQTIGKSIKTKKEEINNLLVYLFRWKL